MTNTAETNDDITALILDDHDTFRRGFAALDELQSPDTDPEEPEARLCAVWGPLADLLDVHAVAEERIFYPVLLRKGDSDKSDEGDAVDETLDAIGDHNDIRDATRAAARHRPGSDAWWEAVNQARTENTEHMGEEEDEALADFRRNTTRAQRAELGRKFTEFKAAHTAADLDTSGQDPERYVDEHLADTAETALGGVAGGH
ncbi:hemerythrin domain-containing protein [Sporichthya sp.]|uniref:hemerythrin domain-containing protein n=1 Tax=Sporichthya sp. TaxID=65475 RepID=UPI0017A083E7|nr:hemerythrin domain-containing protein [Sporichthya sp.]MBA3745117.1 hemerythrin domain-containing protein [Sporichthya sp.]